MTVLRASRDRGEPDDLGISELQRAGVAKQHFDRGRPEWCATWRACHRPRDLRHETRRGGQ
jgi:hypothetical protein